MESQPVSEGFPGSAMLHATDPGGLRDLGSSPAEGGKMGSERLGDLPRVTKPVVYGNPDLRVCASSLIPGCNP